ncbi:bicyclomycin/multidrug efflux system [compost metagenome]
MGVSGLVTGFAPAVGPTLAGWLIAHFTWRHLFYTVLPVSLLVLLLVMLFMKNVTEHREGHFDTRSPMHLVLKTPDNQIMISVE